MSLKRILGCALSIPTAHLSRAKASLTRERPSVTDPLWSRVGCGVLLQVERPPRQQGIWRGWEDETTAAAGYGADANTLAHAMAHTYVSTLPRYSAALCIPPKRTSARLRARHGPRTHAGSRANATRPDTSRSTSISKRSLSPILQRSRCVSVHSRMTG